MNKAQINRRNLMASALITGGAVSLAGGKEDKNTIRSVVHNSGDNEFTLFFECGAKLESIKALGGAFSITFLERADSFDVKLSGQTYRKSLSAKTISSKGKVETVAVTWKSFAERAILSLYINEKFAVKIDFKSPARHASPYLKEFTEISFKGSAIRSFSEVGKCLDENEVLEFAAGKKFEVSDESDLVIGPYVGQLSSTEAMLWLRGNKNCLYQLRVYDKSEVVLTENKKALSENDCCLVWHVKNLKAGSHYTYEVQAKSKMMKGPDYYFNTPTEDNSQAVKLLFGSCADILDSPLYRQIKSIKPDGLFFMGDTPYVDHNVIAVHRHSHRQFLNIESFRDVLRNTPFIGTWDDHDFGFNNADGLYKDKDKSYRAFKEYRPQFTYGDGREGIYTKTRFGPVEVFVLDTRWFAYTKASFIDPQEKTLLGRQQWEWLTESLKQSTATFKVLASSMIWDDKENKEKDDWHTYNAEKIALCDFIRNERIEGVCLLGGDIHVSRLLKYNRELVGYDLYQFISSPMHKSVIKSLNVENDSLEWSALEKNTFMTLEVVHENDEAVLIAEFINNKGKAIKTVKLPASLLAR